MAYQNNEPGVTYPKWKDRVRARKAKKVKFPPGTLLWDEGRNLITDWVPWTTEDLNPHDTVEFVPQLIPTLFSHMDEEGRQILMVDVNDLRCYFEVGVTNVRNRFFYNAYKNAEDQHRQAEQFKRDGPDGPWAGMGGRNSWHYEPASATMGIDTDGRYLRSDVEYDINGLPITKESPAKDRKKKPETKDRKKKLETKFLDEMIHNPIKKAVKKLGKKRK